jgi:hypothetical protein
MDSTERFVSICVIHLKSAKAMKPAKKTTPLSGAREEIDLLELELQIAKRADTLWRRGGCRSGRDLVHWLQAEREVIQSHPALGRPLVSAPNVRDVALREACVVS